MFYQFCRLLFSLRFNNDGLLLLQGLQEEEKREAIIIVSSGLAAGETETPILRQKEPQACESASSPFIFNETSLKTNWNITIALLDQILSNTKQTK